MTSALKASICHCGDPHQIESVPQMMRSGPSTARSEPTRCAAASGLSVKAVAKALRERGYEVTEVLVGEDCAFEVPAGTEVAFVAMHGGQLPELDWRLESARIG